MGLISECKEQRKESVNFQTEQQKLPNLNNRRYTENKIIIKPQRSVGLNKKSNTCLIRVPERKETCRSGPKKYAKK